MNIENTYLRILIKYSFRSNDESHVFADIQFSHGSHAGGQEQSILLRWKLNSFIMQILRKLFYCFKVPQHGRLVNVLKNQDIRDSNSLLFRLLSLASLLVMLKSSCCNIKICEEACSVYEFPGIETKLIFHFRLRNYCLEQRLPPHVIKHGP